MHPIFYLLSCLGSFSSQIILHHNKNFVDVHRVHSSRVVLKIGTFDRDRQPISMNRGTDTRFKSGPNNRQLGTGCWARHKRATVHSQRQQHSFSYILYRRTVGRYSYVRDSPLVMVTQAAATRPAKR